MEIFLLLILIVGGLFLCVQLNKSLDVNTMEEIDEEPGYIEILRNNRLETVMRFQSGQVLYGTNEAVMGYYDNEGNVYNDKREKIGFVRNEKMYMSREFEYDKLVKMFPRASLNKPSDLIRFLGELWGCTIYEDDCCNNATASFCLRNETVLGAGAAYIVAVYEDVIPSSKRAYYRMEVTECLHKNR